MQQVNCVLLLPVHNRFQCLEVENESTLPPSPPVQPLDKVTPKSVQPHWFLRLHAWERHLLKWYVVASTPSSKSLVIKVGVQSTDTREVKSSPALVDCDAMGQFMDRSYVECNCLTTQKLIHPITIYNVVGTPNEVGSITEIVDAILQFNDHSEHTSFAVTSLGKQDIILGFTWL